MSLTLRFGRDRQWDAPWSTEPQWQRIGPVGHQPLDDPAAAVAAALEDPLEFPPLKSAVIPGDRVAIAVGPDLPDRDRLLAGLLMVLDEARVDPADVTICYSPDEPIADGEPGSRLAKAQHVVHRPDEPTSMSYLAASAAARPIYFLRALCDADVVIPLGCTRPRPATCRTARGTSLFPIFSDRETQQRWQDEPEAGLGVDEAAEAAWLLGAQFAIEVIPGPGESVLQVIAGDREGVGRRSSQLAHAVWSKKLEHRVDTVVATLAARTRPTRWRDVATAVENISAIVNPDGIVVLCTDLGGVPAESPLELPADLRVYLVSDAPGDEVESCGLVPLESNEELARLVERLEGGVILEDADRIVVELANAASGEERGTSLVLKVKSPDG